MLDKKDEIILTELKKNARLYTKQVAKNVGMPRVTVSDRIHKMINNGVIKLFSAIPDYGKIGLPVTVYILISYISDSGVTQRALAERVSKIPGVFEVHIITGAYDLLIKVRGKSLEDVGKFVIDKLRSQKAIRKTFTIACFNTIKEDV
jgi:DNA-binding Lrp family transcriptional regulator